MVTQQANPPPAAPPMSIDSSLSAPLVLQLPAYGLGEMQTMPSKPLEPYTHMRDQRPKTSPWLLVPSWPSSVHCGHLNSKLSENNLSLPPSLSSKKLK